MKALLLIDIQNDYFPGGAMELVGSEAAGNAAGRLLAAFRTRGLPVVHIQHVSTRPGSGFFLPDTEGVRIHASVSPLAHEPVIIKHYPNSFRDTGTEQVLRSLGVTELVVAGMMTHMCVDTTVRAAFDMGFACHLAHDACATRDLAFMDAVVPAQQVQAAYMAALGSVFAEVATADALCAAL